MNDCYGWVGKILRVDLSLGEISEESTLPYAHDYIGGRGLAARIAWQEIPPATKPLDPENLLMFLTGPLTGTTASLSGRLTIAGLAPQVYPYEWFTYSGMGGHFGPELKYAGYDGLIVKGQASSPVYIWIHDGQAEICPADHLWGLGTYRTQELLMEKHGPGTRVVSIGQAGENLSRLAIINSETEAAAGQGGFGAVMGAKNLKAVAVKGSGRIAIAKPEEFLHKSQAIAEELREGMRWGPRAPDQRLVVKYGAKFQACSQQCTRECARYYRHVRGVLHPEATYAGQMHCVGGLFPGSPRNMMYNWDLGFRAGFEAHRLANDYGLNHWELLLGIMPWLRACREKGLLKEVDGLSIDLDNPTFWAEVLRKISYREGMGNALAEGGIRAAEILGLGQELLSHFYTAWGFAGHWDGHQDYANYVVFPYWVVSALQWAAASRDPFSSGHGYSQSLMRACPFSQWPQALTWEQIMYAAERTYGSKRAGDPLSGYEYKAQPAIWEGNRSVLKDSAPACDQVFPRIWSIATEDGFARADGMDGPQFEHHLLISATGAWESPEEIDEACERIFSLERAIHIRSHGRSRADDESVVPAFERPEVRPSPLLGEPQALDREKFRKLLDEYYTLRGWDEKSGRPTRATLEKLGLADVAEELAGLGLMP